MGLMTNYQKEEGWKPEYEKEPGLEAPAFSYEDLIGSGLLKLVASGAVSLGSLLAMMKMGAKKPEGMMYPKQAGAVGAKESLWHGSYDPSWIDRGDAFDPSKTVNMKSKYLWLSPRKEVAETYAGISEMQKWKAEQGMNKAAPSTAGVREFEQRGARTLKVSDVNKASKKLGIEWSGENPLEKLLDAAKSAGYDAVKMEMDGGNIAVLSPDKFVLKK